MSETKLNKDGLVPGSLVDPKEHAKILRKMKQDAIKASQKAK